MSGKIKNTAAGYFYADKIGSSMGDYSGSSIDETDEESTISANSNCKSAFSGNQIVLDNFKHSLQKDNRHIRTLAEEFEKFDNLMGERNKT